MPGLQRQVKMLLHPWRSLRFEVARARGERDLVAHVGHHRVHVDPRDERVGRTLYVLRRYEPIETKLVHASLSKGQTFVDVGAHVGYYALIAANKVGPTGSVHAFEPAPDNFALLERNVRDNGYPNLHAFNAAASDANGEADLFLASLNLGGHQLFPSGDKPPGGPAVRVRTVRLDDHFREHGITPDVMKVDVEGAEAHVFEGMSRTFEEGKPDVLFFEFSPGPLRAAGMDPLDLLESLASRGYEIGMIPKTRGQRVRLARPEHVARYVEQRFSFMDLVLTRRGAPARG